MTKVLVVDDELSIVEVLKTVLKRNGYEVTATDNGAGALEILKAEKFELMISDIRMKPMDGLELLVKAREIQPSLSVIMMTAYATIETAVETMKAGAYDYVCKPFKIDELLLTVERAIASVFSYPLKAHDHVISIAAFVCHFKGHPMRNLMRSLFRFVFFEMELVKELIAYLQLVAHVGHVLSMNR